MEGNSIRTFENLCKIFEMRIKLDNAKGEPVSEEVSENYEKYAKKIDNFYNEEFQLELKDLISPCDTLEKERERLEKLIALLEKRLERRSALAGEYHQTTGKYIKNLQLIVSDNELNNKKERLALITKYLDTVKEIDDINDSVVKLKSELDEEEEKKEEYFERNKTLEDELYSEFVTSINEDEYYRDIEEDKLLDILADVSKKASENKETLDITKESVESLLSTGMDDEYESYIEEASKGYSLWHDREIILSIYKLVIDFEDEFEQLLSKRKAISDLLEERKNIAYLDNSSILRPFEELMLEQGRVLDREKGILDNIVNYTNRIDFKEERLEELEKVIKEPEILVILKEYNLYDLEDRKEVAEDSEEPENIVIKEHKPYAIISVEDAPVTLNVNLAKLKGMSVRDKVNKKLNPEVPNLDNTLELPVIPEENSEFNIPVFEGENEENNMHEEVVEEPVEENAESEDSLPVETEESTDEVPAPVEESVSLDDSLPSLELPEESSEESNEEPTTEEDSSPADNNSFWVPVSDSKLEPGDFPNINIPIINENLNNEGDNFGFPDVNN